MQAFSSLDFQYTGAFDTSGKVGYLQTAGILSQSIKQLRELKRSHFRPSSGTVWVCYIGMRHELVGELHFNPSGDYMPDIEVYDLDILRPLISYMNNLPKPVDEAAFRGLIKRWGEDLLYIEAGVDTYKQFRFSAPLDDKEVYFKGHIFDLRKLPSAHAMATLWQWVFQYLNSIDPNTRIKGYNGINLPTDITHTGYDIHIRIESLAPTILITWGQVLPAVRLVQTKVQELDPTSMRCFWIDFEFLVQIGNEVQRCSGRVVVNYQNRLIPAQSAPQSNLTTGVQQHGLQTS